MIARIDTAAAAGADVAGAVAVDADAAGSVVDAAPYAVAAAPDKLHQPWLTPLQTLAKDSSASAGSGVTQVHIQGPQRSEQSGSQLTC